MKTFKNATTNKLKTTQENQKNYHMYHVSLVKSKVDNLAENNSQYFPCSYQIK